MTEVFSSHHIQYSSLSTGGLCFQVDIVEKCRLLTTIQTGMQFSNRLLSANQQVLYSYSETVSGNSFFFASSVVGCL